MFTVVGLTTAVYFRRHPTPDPRPVSMGADNFPSLRDAGPGMSASSLGHAPRDRLAQGRFSPLTDIAIDFFDRLLSQCAWSLVRGQEDVDRLCARRPRPSSRTRGFEAAGARSEGRRASRGCSASGRGAVGPAQGALTRAIDFAQRRGDAIVVTKLDRLARSVADLVRIVERLTKKKRRPAHPEHGRRHRDADWQGSSLKCPWRRDRAVLSAR